MDRGIREELVRGLGLVVGVTKTGAARAQPLSHRWLTQLRVLQRAPASWPDSPRLDVMPWGSKRMERAAASPPLGFEGPWPQPPVVDPEFSPPVLDVPREERRLHQRYNVLRYLGQVSALTPIAAARALRGPRVVELDDDRFCELINETSFAQFITTNLDEADRRNFADIMDANPAPAEAWAKIDATAVEPAHALPGVHVAPSQTLLRFDGVTFRPLAIRLTAEPATIYQPGDGPAWALSRYFVLQALQYLLVLVFHPRLHFPGDTINAVSRTLLPPTHRLAKLLQPHMRFTLGLHEAVIHHRRSVLHNSQRELYTPFPVTTEGIHQGVTRGMRGWEGKAAYPVYEFGPKLLDPRLTYGRYRRDWYSAFRVFVARVLTDVAGDDAYVVRWADAISKWLPGFPDGAAIQDDGVLVDAVATYLAEVSVFHSADHHSYAGIPIAEIPWRLRRPPPNLEPLTSLDLGALVTSEDFFRHQLCHAMFFAPVVIEPLRKVSYGFRPPELGAARADFDSMMETLDRRWAGSTFPSSTEIATSLQY